MKKDSTKKFKKKWVIVPVVIFAVIAVVCAFTQNLGSTKPTGYPVTEGTAETGILQETVSIKGNVEGSEKAEIQSTQTAEVKAIYVEEGDKVSKGQLLAVLDSGDLNEQYSKAKLSANESKRKADDAKVLYEQGALPENDYLDAKAAHEADILNLGTFDFEKVNITSPIAGTVTRVNVTVGSNSNNTTDNKSMFIIEDLQNLQLNVKASEYDISKIKVGQTVTITAEVLGEESATGTVARIAPSGEEKQGSNEMVIPVEIDIDNKDGRLIAGVSAKAEILIERKENVMTVPVDAVLEDVNENTSYVYLIKDNKLKKVKVDIGIEGDFTVEIASKEVKSGDKVVLAPTFELTDGMEVMISNPGAV